jgi:DNA-binding SARP family transcriptional activator
MSDQSTIAGSIELPAAGLRVHLLGPPLVEWAGQALDISRRQVRAILYYLATHLKPIPREHLSYLFWPDMPDSGARRNLSHVLTHLRSNLPVPELLLSADEHIALDPRRIWSDTVTIQQLCTAPQPAGHTEALRQTIDLYRGPFLAGFSLPTSPEFEAWAALEQSSWERHYLEALAALVEGHLACGNHQAAIDYALRYLAVDDLNEDMHRRLIECYAATGDRSAAMRQFERCAVTLERELGISPLPETRAAYQIAMSGRLPSPQPQAVPPATWTTWPTIEAPLIGRENALRYLHEAYDDARLGRGRLVLISGEPGMGKTRLLQHFVAGLANTVNVVACAGHQAESTMPYWPLVEALRPHLPLALEGTPDLAPAYLAELARLWPELHGMRPNLPQVPHLEAGQAQARLFHALTCWLLKLAAWRPPLVLCLDNLHWADEATLTWLGYLGRRLTRAPLLVLGTYCSEDGRALGPLRGELERSGLVHEMRLEGLSQAEVLDLVRCLSGQKGGARRFSRRLHQVTGGNPFYLLETLRVMFEAGVLWQDDTGWNVRADKRTVDYRELPLPDTVCEVIRARLGRLSPQARQVLEAGAVLGPRFGFDGVWAVSGRRQGETMEALDELLARQIITENDQAYVFKHSLIQQVVYRDLSYGRRRLLQRRAGEALAKPHADDGAAPSRHLEPADG